MHRPCHCHCTPCAPSSPCAVSLVYPAPTPRRVDPTPVSSSRTFSPNVSVPILRDTPHHARTHPSAPASPNIASVYHTPCTCGPTCGAAASSHAPQAEEPPGTLVPCCHCCCTTPATGPTESASEETSPPSVPVLHDAVTSRTPPSAAASPNIAGGDNCIPCTCTTICDNAVPSHALRTEKPPVTLVSSCNCCCATPALLPTEPIPEETSPPSVPVLHDAVTLRTPPSAPASPNVAGSYRVPFTCTNVCDTAVHSQVPRAEERPGTLMSSCDCCCTTPAVAPKVPIPDETAPARAPELYEPPSRSRGHLFPPPRPDIASSRVDDPLGKQQAFNTDTAAIRTHFLPTLRPDIASSPVDDLLGEPPALNLNRATIRTHLLPPARSDIASSFVDDPMGKPPALNSNRATIRTHVLPPARSDIASSRDDDPLGEPPALNTNRAAIRTHVLPPARSDIARLRVDDPLSEPPALNTNRAVTRNHSLPPASRDIASSSLDDPVGNYDRPTPAAVYMRPASALTNGQPMYSAIHHVEHEYVPEIITKHVFHYA